MGAIKKAFSLGAATTLLGATLLLGSSCNYTKNQDSEKERRITEKVVYELNKQSIEGMMHPELSERKSSVKFAGHSFDLDNAEILKYYHTDKSDKLVIYIRDVHKSSSFEGSKLIQENIYNTIDELCNENGTELLVIEGTSQEEMTKEFIDSNIGFLTKALLKLSYGFCMPETKKDALEAFSGPTAYEYINDTKIKTCGAEDANIHEIGLYMINNPIKSEGWIWLFDKVIIEKRNEIGVEKTLKHMEKYGKKQAILVFGAAHTKGLTELLEKEGVSYIVIQPKGVDDYIRNLENDARYEQ